MVTVYQVIVQMISNAYILRSPLSLQKASSVKASGELFIIIIIIIIFHSNLTMINNDSSTYLLDIIFLFFYDDDDTGSPKASGSMSFPLYGAVLLVIAAIMCFTMDNWLGIGD